MNFNPGTVLPRKKVVPKACSSRVFVPVVKPYDQLYKGINTRQYRAEVRVKLHTWLALVISGTSVHVTLLVEYCIFKLSICADGTVLISIFIRLHSFAEPKSKKIGLASFTVQDAGYWFAS